MTTLDPRLEGPLDRLRDALNASKHNTPSSELRNFVHVQTLDSYRLGVTIQHVLDASGDDAETVPALAVELLVRNVVEAAITSNYVVLHADDGSVARAITTSAQRWEHSWDGPSDFRAEYPGNDVLPYVTTMAAVDHDLRAAWRSLSYLTHPRSALSYSGAENAGVLLGWTRRYVFELRAGKALEWYALAADRLLDALTAATEREGTA